MPNVTQSEYLSQNEFPSNVDLETRSKKILQMVEYAFNHPTVEKYLPGSTSTEESKKKAAEDAEKLKLLNPQDTITIQMHNTPGWVGVNSYYEYPELIAIFSKVFNKRTGQRLDPKIIIQKVLREEMGHADEALKVPTLTIQYGLEVLQNSVNNQLLFRPAISFEGNATVGQYIRIHEGARIKSDSDKIIISSK